MAAAGGEGVVMGALGKFERIGGRQSAKSINCMIFFNVIFHKIAAMISASFRSRRCCVFGPVWGQHGLIIIDQAGPNQLQKGHSE